MLPEYIWFYIKSGWYVDVHIVSTLLRIVNFCRPPTDLNRATSFVSSLVNAIQRDVCGARQCEKRSLGKTEFSIAEVYLQNGVAVHRVWADIITKKPLCDSE
jgi:hypothetical protein